MFKKRDMSFEKYKIQVEPSNNINTSDQMDPNNDQSGIEEGISPYSEFNG